MSDMDEDDYGDIADKDLMEVFSQASQSLPPYSQSPRSAKRCRVSDDISDDEGPPTSRLRRSRKPAGSGGSGDEEEENGRAKKKKYKIHIGDKAVPAARILGATQAEALPDSSPYRIRGPIYKKPRPEPTNSPLFTPASRATATQRRTSNQSTLSFDHELDDIPSDAFSSQEYGGASKGPVISRPSSLRATHEIPRPRQHPATPIQGLCQTTLFGGRAPEEVSASQAKKVHNFIVDKPPEAPTHHVLNEEALKTWTYPTNLGAIREYQYSIVRNGLFNNTLVALPTGLGKTFIAATIMYNFYRWTRDAQIVFVAPTKPLVAQQVDACFGIVGIPKSQTTMLTGEQPPALRAEEWEGKRVFFMTPQTLENDLASGIADPKKIVLLVVDEAHRATGNYAYVKVVSFLRRFNKSFRVLALTATPGSTVEAVQEVVDGLEISKVEIRTEESIDIQQYVHRRNIDQIVLDPSDEIIMIKDLFSKTLQPLVTQLCSQNAFYNRDPMSITTFGLMQARKNWMNSPAGRNANMGLKGMMNALFTILASIAHSIKLLNFHGIGPFYSAIKDFRQNVEDGNKGGKYRKQITDSADFKKMMDYIKMWLSKDDFVGHPKLTYLCDTILNHFLDAGEGRLGDDAPPSATRVIVFSEYRDSAEDITRVLNRHGPMIRASVFVGQADSKRSEGMNQTKQIETINMFKSGKINVIVATSIGEEGLDIGQVDLIVCYDASSSPIRMLQRMGRTGRKRAGNIVLLLMRGKEEDSFAKAKDNYEQMQKMISSGQRFNFRHDLSVRIIPRGIIPEVDKRIIEIPIENTQGPALPLPKRRATKGKKKPPKKFHMPDGVETGFRKASKLSDGDTILTKLGVTVGKKAVGKKAVGKKAVGKKEARETQLATIPPLNSVFLSTIDMKELERLYQNIAGNDMQEVSMPEMTSQPLAQRSLGPTAKVSHGQYTMRCVKLFKRLADLQDPADRWTTLYPEDEPTQSFWDPPALVEDESTVKKVPKATKAKNRAVPMKTKQIPKPALAISDIESDANEVPGLGRKQQQQARNRILSLSPSESEGQGDDCLNSEAPSKLDSDGCESLQDFIDDGVQLSTGVENSFIVRSSTTPPPRAPEPKRKPFSEPTQPEDIVDTSDDDMPDIDELVGSKPTSNSVVPMTDPDTDDGDVRPPGRREKTRKVVEDSDSDGE